MACRRECSKHENGKLERVPFFSLPRDISPRDNHPPCCRSCFDYMNGLADITVGYLAAPLYRKKIYQWVIVRTEKGGELCHLVTDELEILPEVKGGDCRKTVKNFALRAIDQMKPGEGAAEKAGRYMPIWAGKIMAALMTRFGPRGLEFARYAIDTHLIQNYYFVKYNYPKLLPTLVPKHVYQVFKEYNLAP